MSSSSGSSTDDSIFDVEELLHIEARCRELRKEKDLLKETQSQSFDLIRRLELHVRRLNEARLEDKRQILELERELNNCHQEIDYLQDQLNERTLDVDCLEERVGTLESKLADLDILEEEIVSLREELQKSNSQCEFLMQGLEFKETELQNSNFHIEKLEESISSSALEYECEIESIRLEMMALEHRSFEGGKPEQALGEERARLNEYFQFEEAQKVIKHLEEENKQLRESLDASKKEITLFCRRVEVHFEGWLENSIEGERYDAKGICSCGDNLGPLLSKLLMIEMPLVECCVRGEETSSQLHESDRLAKQLKEELRQEKFRAKEEAEDLAQEMAELRYQLTELLEEERKRRAFVEQASLQRISELEAQLQSSKQNLFPPFSETCEA